MENNKLSGIERQLVLQYLMDGNVPVTLTPISNDKTDDGVKSLNSQIFPVAIKPEKITVEKSGKIYLEIPPENNILHATSVRVEFYFNRVGLFFVSKIDYENNKIVIYLPEEIDRIKDVEEEVNYDITGILYFEYEGKKELNEKCIPWNDNELFERPIWKSIPLENQQLAKSYLEKFVEDGKTQKNIGNGLQLIPICNFITNQNNDSMEAIQGRKKDMYILYLDHERIVLGIENPLTKYEEKSEFGLKLSFSIKESPILSRDIYVTFYVNKIYKNEKSSRICLDCVYTSIQEEDVRYLYEKATKRLFV